MKPGIPFTLSDNSVIFVRNMEFDEETGSLNIDYDTKDGVDTEFVEKELSAIIIESLTLACSGITLEDDTENL